MPTNAYKLSIVHIILILIAFFMIIGTLLINELFLYAFAAIVLVLNILIFNKYARLNIISLLLTYVIISPFRFFISLHLPFDFPVALPLDIILLLIVFLSVNKLRNLLKDKLVILFFVLYFWGLFEIFNPNSDLITGILGFRNRTMGAIFFIIGITAVKDKMIYNKITKMMIIVLSIVAVYGIIQFFIPTGAQLEVYQRNLNQSNYFMADRSTLRRAFSTLTSPGAFGVSMFYLFFLLRLNAARNLFKSKLNYKTLLTINLIALLLSGSRSSLIAVILITCFEMISKGMKAKSIATVAFISVVTLSVSFIYSKTEVAGRLLGLLNPLGSGSSFVSRLDIWEVLQTTIINKPSGFGIGSTGIEVGSKFVDSPISDKFAILTDNEYITLLYEQGWIGCLLYVIFMISLIVIFLKHRDADPDSTTIIRYMAFFTITYAILAVPIQLSQIFPINWFAWLLLGMTYSLTIRKADVKPSVASICKYELFPESAHFLLRGKTPLKALAASKIN